MPEVTMSAKGPTGARELSQTSKCQGVLGSSKGWEGCSVRECQGVVPGCRVVPGSRKSVR